MWVSENLKIRGLVHGSRFFGDPCPNSEFVVNFSPDSLEGNFEKKKKKYQFNFLFFFMKVELLKEPTTFFLHFLKFDFFEPLGWLLIPMYFRNYL